MAYELRDGQGSLFKNERKESEKHPDYTGSAKIDGRDFWLSAWIKEGTKGKFMSLALKPKDATSPPVRKALEHQLKRDMDDEIPF
jgi:phage repressor protein C with HTH and peptisase S24 domain